METPLSKNFADDQTRILDALRTGRSFISNYRCADARGFRFWIDGNGPAAFPGPSINFREGLRARAELPLEGTMVLLRNGEAVRQSEGKTMEFSLKQPGIYRLEVERKKRAWIFSNPVYINP
jgi:hypothetical protein